MADAIAEQYFFPLDVIINVTMIISFLRVGWSSSLASNKYIFADQYLTGQ